MKAAGTTKLKAAREILVALQDGRMMNETPNESLACHAAER